MDGQYLHNFMAMAGQRRFNVILAKSDNQAS